MVNRDRERSNYYSTTPFLAYPLTLAGYTPNIPYLSPLEQSILALQ